MDIKMFTEKVLSFLKLVYFRYFVTLTENRLKCPLEMSSSINYYYKIPIVKINYVLKSKRKYEDTSLSEHQQKEETI